MRNAVSFVAVAPISGVRACREAGGRGFLRLFRRVYGLEKLSAGEKRCEGCKQQGCQMQLFRSSIVFCSDSWSLGIFLSL